MSQEDLEINRGIRRIMVRHWIDLGQLSLRSAAGRVYIRGDMERIYGSGEEITATLLDTIFSEIKRVRGVKNVTPDLQNWSNESGAWKPSGAQTAKKSDKDEASGTGKTYDIKDVD